MAQHQQLILKSNNTSEIIKEPFSSLLKMAALLPINTTQAPTQHTFGITIGSGLCVTLSVYIIILVITGTTFNISLMFTIYANKKLHKKSNYLIVNLAFGELISALFILPLDCEFLLNHYYVHSEFICGLNRTLFLISLPLSLMSAFLVTFEKLLVFLFPFEQHRVFTKRTLYITLGFVWTYSLFAGCFPILYNTHAAHIINGICVLEFPVVYFLYQVYANFMFPLFCILIMDLMILWIARRSIADRRRLSNEYAKVDAGIAAGNWRTSKTVMIMGGNECICWLLLISVALSNFYCGSCNPRELVWIMSAINYTRVATNPVIYGLRNKSIRQIVVSSFKRHFVTHKSHDDDHDDNEVFILHAGRRDLPEKEDSSITNVELSC